MDLRYGTNPHQRAAVQPVAADRWPIRILHGSPSYINVLDVLNGWQLVQKAGRSLGRPAAASFKHVSPAGVAVAGLVDDATAGQYGLDGRDVGAVTSAYLRARDADPKCSCGDIAAVSIPVDAELADVLGRVVCDGIVAPGYDPGVVETLSRKQHGRFLVVQADPSFTPPAVETRDLFGVRLSQERDTVPVTPALLDDVIGGPLAQSTVDDLLLGLIVVRYTQSNSVCYVRDGVTLGIGAGQQSRVDCTRLAGAKTDMWWLRRHPVVAGLEFLGHVRRQDRINGQLRFLDAGLASADRLRLNDSLVHPIPQFTDRDRAEWLDLLAGVAFVSDGLLSFRDNVEEASAHGVGAIAEPGGTLRRSAEIEDSCREHGIALARTSLRLFHH